jgi:hypothetical protein
MTSDGGRSAMAGPPGITESLPRRCCVHALCMLRSALLGAWRAPRGHHRRRRLVPRLQVV